MVEKKALSGLFEGLGKSRGKNLHFWDESGGKKLNIFCKSRGKNLHFSCESGGKKLKNLEITEVV